MIIENLPGTEKSFKIILRSKNGAALQTGFISDSRKAMINMADLAPGTYFYKLCGKLTVLKTGMLVKR